MRSIDVAPGGGVAALHLAERPRPTCDGDGLLVRVRAAALNHADIYQRDGLWPAPPDAPDTLGVEVAGIVERPDAGGRFGIGDRVIGLLSGGGYAEYACLDAGLAAPIPPSLGFAEAACLPEAVVVGHSNLVELARVRPGERVLLHGGASGMGSLALQMATLLGARVATTTSDMGKAQRLDELGAEAVFDRRSPKLADKLRAWAPDGIDVVVDIGGADTLALNIDCLADRGRLVLMGVMSGTIVRELDIDPILLKRLHVLGTVFRPTPLAERRVLARAAYDTWLPRVASGELRPVLHAVHPLEAAAAAHVELEAGSHVGKIVLDTSGIVDTLDAELPAAVPLKGDKTCRARFSTT